MHALPAPGFLHPCIHLPRHLHLHACVLDAGRRKEAGLPAARCAQSFVDLLYLHHQQLMADGGGQQAGSSRAGSPTRLPGAAAMDVDMADADEPMPLAGAAASGAAPAQGGLQGGEGLLDALHNLALRLDVERPLAGSKEAIQAALAYAGMTDDVAIRVQRSAVY